MPVEAPEGTAARNVPEEIYMCGMKMRKRSGVMRAEGYKVGGEGCGRKENKRPKTNSYLPLAVVTSTSTVGLPRES